MPAECEARFTSQDPNGACVSDDDKIELCGLEERIDTVMQTCGMTNCITQIGDTSEGGALAQCGTDCVSEQTQLSDGCSGCFGNVLACTMRECGAEALGSIGGDTAALDACVEANCGDSFSACAGIPFTR